MDRFLDALPYLPSIVFGGAAIWLQANGDTLSSQHYIVLTWLAAISARLR